MATNKTRNRTEREHQLAEVATLHEQGLTQVKIAKAVGVSQPQVAYDLRIIQTRYRATQVDKVDGRVAKIREQYREVRREAWLAWERSKEDAGMVVEDFANAKGSYASREGIERRIRRVVTRAGRLPANQYLLTILAALKAERELDGLDAERPAAPMVNVVVAGAVFWSGLAKQVAAQMPLAVETRVLRAVESQPDS
jgi:hypothetical protein